jgi:hypothetical protein
MDDEGLAQRLAQSPEVETRPAIQRLRFDLGSGGRSSSLAWRVTP